MNTLSRFFILREGIIGREFFALGEHSGEFEHTTVLVHPNAQPLPPRHNFVYQHHQKPANWWVYNAKQGESCLLDSWTMTCFVKW
jgi:asparagine synthetase B (glutamine-hydrolysing)